MNWTGTSFEGCVTHKAFALDTAMSCHLFFFFLFFFPLARLQMLRDFNLEFTDAIFVDMMAKLDPAGSGVITYEDFTEHFGSFVVGGSETAGGSFGQGSATLQPLESLAPAPPLLFICSTLPRPNVSASCRVRCLGHDPAPG